MTRFTISLKSFLNPRFKMFLSCYDLKTSFRCVRNVALRSLLELVNSGIASKESLERTERFLD